MDDSNRKLSSAGENLSDLTTNKEPKYDSGKEAADNISAVSAERKETPTDAPPFSGDAPNSMPDAFPPDDGCIAAFPADLNREEYIRFNEEVSRTSGLLRFRKGQIILFAVMAVLSLGMMILDGVLARTVDPVLALLVVFLAVSGVLLFYEIPRYVRKTAEKAYDQSMLNGYSYYGLIRVYPDRVEKEGENRTTILLRENAVYIETRDMMILLAPNTPAIVLTARCLTPADADGVRRAVLPGVPLPRQRLTERMIPLADRPIPPPEKAEAEEQETELFALDVDYTKEEFVKIVTDTALRSYLKMLPIYSGLSLLAGLIFGLMNGLGVGIASFLLISGVLFALNVLTARGKAVRAYDSMPEGSERIRVGFSEQGLTVRSARPGESLRFVWRAINRAVERPDSVEFYTPTSFLRIPKRCIPQMEELKTLVDAHVQPKTGRK